MCLTVYAKKNETPEPKIAENDIHCYKILSINDWENFEEKFDKDFQLKTPYRGFEMEAGKHYEEKEENLVVSRRYHYDDDENDPWEVNEGMFHSYASIEDAVQDVVEFQDGNIIFHAIIPKGAKYFAGEFGSVGGYASNEIIITENVAFFDDYFELLDSASMDEGESIEVLYRNELNNRDKIVEKYNLPLNEDGYIDKEKLMALSLDELNY